MKIKKLSHLFILYIIIMSVLVSCSLFPSSSATKTAQPTPNLSQVLTIQLTVQADPSVFNAVGQSIKYNYTVKNAGAASAPGPVMVTGAACPEIKTIGNLDANLDVNETLVCTSAYTITQTDIDKGSVTNIVTAAVNGVSSSQVTTAITTAQPVVLKLAKSANPTSYDHVGQTITYTYIIMNSGVATLGPAQFVVSDPGISAPINCGDAALTLASNATATCSATYTITQANLDSGSVATNATVSGGGAAPSQPASATITKGAAVIPPNTTPSNLTSGSTIQHTVIDGEWLWQIARCYGTDPTKVIQANPQLANPAQIKPGTVVTVPNIGSAGKIYAPRPCVEKYTVQNGDTWSTIALKYNADVSIMQMVNSNTLVVGKEVRVPPNSAGATTTATTTTTTGSTGTCVDLTRSLKFSGVNANTTHFNICGPIDAAGNMKIATIGIKQRPEDVGLGGLTQDITQLIETSTKINDANSLIIGDMNYDGNDDFRIVKFLPAGPNIPYLYYIYNPTSHLFEYSKAYENITSPEFPGNSELRSQWRESAAKWGIDTYTIANSIPKLTKRETWEAISATQAKHQITLTNADGSSVLNVDEVIPLITP